MWFDDGALMTELVRYPLGSGEAVFEIDEAGQSGQALQHASRSSAGGIASADEDFAEAAKRVQPVADELLKRLSGLQVTPAEIVVEFGLKVSYKAGIVIAAHAADANFAVKLTWRRDAAAPAAVEPQGKGKGA